MRLHNFKEIKAWQKSRELVKEVYIASAEFPVDERFGITSQVRRAVVSIPTNIAEAFGRESDKEIKLFLNYAYGSAYEVESLLILACDLEMISVQELERLSISMSEVQKLIFGLQKKFKTDSLVSTQVS